MLCSIWFVSGCTNKGLGSYGLVYMVMEAGDRNEYIEFELNSYDDEMSDLDNAQIDGKSNTDTSDWCTDRGWQMLQSLQYL